MVYTSDRQGIAIIMIRIRHTFLTHSFLISKDPLSICNDCQTLEKYVKEAFQKDRVTK